MTEWIKITKDSWEKKEADIRHYIQILHIPATPEPLKQKKEYWLVISGKVTKAHATHNRKKCNTIEDAEAYVNRYISYKINPEVRKIIDEPEKLLDAMNK